MPYNTILDIYEHLKVLEKLHKYGLLLRCETISTVLTHQSPEPTSVELRGNRPAHTVIKHTRSHLEEVSSYRAP